MSTSDPANRMTDLIDSHRARFGPYEIDLHTREIWKFGTRIKLVGQPFEILSVFVSRPGELVTRDELRDRLWPSETFVDFNHGLNAAMNKLRDVLSDSADDPKYIETLPRRGYRFIAKVEHGTAAPAEPNAEAVVPTPESAVPVLANGEPESPRLGRGASRTVIGVLVGAGLLIAIVAIAVLFATRSRTAPELGMAAPMKGTQRVVAYGGKNEAPQFSPDGRKLVYMSDRNVGHNLWVANADGSEARQLTTIGDTGTPRWSPDGTTVAFDAHVGKSSAILAVAVTGGDPRVVVAGPSNNSVPSYSHDGKFLYFASDRTGRYEVWRLSLHDGKQEQLTHDGGFAPLETADGKTIFYAKNQFPHPEIWDVPTAGGPESHASATLRPATWACWTPHGDEIYFVEEGPGDVAMLSAYNPAMQTLRQITYLGRYPFWLAVSPNGKIAAFDRADAEDAVSVVELENFQ